MVPRWVNGNVSIPVGKFLIAFSSRFSSPRRVVLRPRVVSLTNRSGITGRSRRVLATTSNDRSSPSRCRWKPSTL